MECSSCGAEVPDGARFCPSCGSAQATGNDERRVVSVVMADIVGFTALAERADPEHVKNLVDRCFERLVADARSFGGALDKIVGDQLVVTFGAHVAHEDDAERAVRAALAMQASAQDLGNDVGIDLALRIGVNTGEVLVGAMRAGGDPTVMGDVVNTASRLETTAEPGAIVVGQKTYELTRSVVSYESLGTLQVRGRDGAVDAWRARATTAPPGRRGRIRGMTPLVGREPELAALRAALDHAVGRSTANLVTLVGEAGIGKMRLLIEIGAIAHRRRLRMLGGHCVPYGEPNPWAPIVEAIRHELGVEQAASLDETRDRLDAVITSVITGSTDDRARIVDAVLGAMELDVGRDVDPARAREEQSRGLFALLEGLARQAPLVLGISDAQWADDLVLELLARLADRLRRQPCLIVVTTREPLGGPFMLPWTANHMTLRVGPLDVEATRALAERLLPIGIDDEIASQLHERSGGNPLFVHELTALLEDSTDLDDEDRNLRALPATLQGLVAARLDALDGDARELACDLAVIGHRGSISAARSISAHGESATFAALEAQSLVTLDLDTYRFTSELVRDVAYQRLTISERIRRHAAAAAWFEREESPGLREMADHVGEAMLLARQLDGATSVPGWPTERAIAVLRAAALAAEADDANQRAGRYWDRIIAIAPPDDTQTIRASRLGRARSACGHHELDLAERLAEEVLVEAQRDGDTAAQAQARVILGRVHHRHGDQAASEQELARALTLFRELGDDAGIAEVLRRQGQALLFAGDLAEASRRIAEALEIYRHGGDQRGEAWSRQTLAWIAFEGTDSEEAEAQLEASIELFGRLGDWGGLSWALGLLAWVRFTQGRLTEAEQLALDIMEEARGSGNRWAQAMMGVLLANVALWTGRCAASIERAERAGAQFRAIEDPWGTFQAAGPQARALSKLGRWSEYDALLAELRPLAAQLANPHMHDVADAIHATCLVDRGAADRALDVIRTLDDGVSIASADRVAAHGLALAQVGRAAEAIAVLEPAYHDASDDGPVTNIGSVLALALAADGRSADARAVLDEIALRNGGTWSDRLRAALARAASLAQDGDEPAARAALEAAADIAQNTDATLDQAIVTVARAAVLDALGAVDQAEAAAASRAAAAELGIDLAGWHVALSAAARGSAPDSANM